MNLQKVNVVRGVRGCEGHKVYCVWYIACVCVVYSTCGRDIGGSVYVQYNMQGV